MCPVIEFEMRAISLSYHIIRACQCPVLSVDSEHLQTLGSHRLPAT